MAVFSAGIVMYRRTVRGPEVLLVHPGGPYWHNKDLGAWSIPKGEYDPDENAETAARREFAEELGVEAKGALRPLGEIRQRSGKHVTAFALEGDLDATQVRSNSFEIEWPPRSGRKASFPEVDRAVWFTLAEAHEKIVAGQKLLLDRLEELIAREG